jgi:predicted membrane-bound spermidine synthase
MGFTLAGMEVLLLLAFQALYGYVYQELAVLIAAFMAGMALGSRLSRSASSLSALAGVQALACVAPAGLCLLAGLRLPGGAGQLLFLCMALASGMLGGYQFPLAGRVYFSTGRRGGLGTLYALDLAGAAAAAALFAAWLIPVFGFLRTALLAAELNLGAALLALPARKPRPPI